MSEQVGIVVIGRNEGERLVRCLVSVRDSGRVVYVDFGSTDGSVQKAMELGADIVPLDLSRPFTAARARNAGLARLRSLVPGVKYVQFVDGDCEIRPEWITFACGMMESDPGIAVVCGRLEERSPDTSIYNRLCQMEWDGPSGTVAACGGIALYSVDALMKSGCFREEMIAGEEPELGFRLRRLGMRLVRLDAPMAMHDAAMTRFGQWFRRARRGGHAYAECFWLHRSSYFRARETARVIAWGIVLPIVIAASACMALVTPWALLGVGAGLCMYLFTLCRAARNRLQRGTRSADAVVYALFCTMAKFPEALGVCQYAFNRTFGRRTRLIEYKR